jgi:mannose-6-phosphate isomerase-like protein (cupin superfamily)
MLVMETVRRVVTGHSPEGKAVFVSDDNVTAAPMGRNPAGGFHQLWGGDVAPTFPDDGQRPAAGPFFPPVGGYRFLVVTMPPSASGGAPATAAPAETVQPEAERRFPGLSSHMETDNPGMHTTDTIDLEYIVSGELVLELDDGADVVLHPGDTVVQNGTRHRWHNRSQEPAVYVAFLLGAHRA